MTNMDIEVKNVTIPIIRGEKGETGARGPKGEQGDKGEQGNIGATGPKGDTGPQGKGLEFSWKGTKLGVRVEGTEEYIYVDIQGPQGEKGEQGNKGEQGIPGLQGIPGDQGAPGDKGDTGPQGPGLEFIWEGTKLGVRTEGLEDYTYVDLKGEKGEKGEQGSQVMIGEQGPQGEQGEKGETGEPGHTPEKGKDYFTELEIIEFTNTITNNVNENLGVKIDNINGEVI